jgi:RHS repeat-associated protein
MVVLTTSLNLQTTGFRFPFGTQMEYNNLATTPGPGWRTTHGLELLRFVDGRVYYEEGVNSVKVFLPITGGNYKATLKKDAKASTGQDHYYWYDRLQQVRQHQRGTLTPTTPPYTGISSLQQTEVLTFDETGNWLSYSATSPSSVTQYRTHNKANWITALTGTPDGVDPVYANTGTMTTMPKVGAWTTAQTLVWDAWNRLIEVNEGKSDVSTNTYDAFHRRIRKVGGGETRDYYYDFNWRSVEERVGTPGSQTVKAQYTWSPTGRWTMIRRKRSTTSTLNEVLYVLKDYLDPAALFSTATSEIVERFGFDAFGPVRFMDKDFAGIGSSVYDWNFLFHAEFMDQESGLYNYGYRFYHLGLGRWTMRDPIGEREGTNPYGMVRNNAANHSDRLGLMGFGDLKVLESDMPRLINDVPPEDPLYPRFQAQTECQLDYSNIKCLPCSENPLCGKISGKVIVHPRTSIWMRARIGGRNKGSFFMSPNLLQKLMQHEAVHVQKCRYLADYWNKALAANDGCSTHCEAIKEALKQAIYESETLPGSHDDPQDWGGGIGVDDFNAALLKEQIDERRNQNKSR